MYSQWAKLRFKGQKYSENKGGGELVKLQNNKNSVQIYK